MPPSHFIESCLKEQLDMIHSVVPLVQCSEYNEHADYPYVSIDDYSAANKRCRIYCFL